MEIFIKVVRFLSPYEIAVWLCILRKTYGYHKTEDWISLSQIEIMTGILQPHVARSKRKLLKKNMIVNIQKGVKIQKDYEKWNIPKWVCLPTEHTQIGNTQTGIYTQTGIAQTGNPDLPKQVDTININVTKEIKTVHLSLSKLLKSKILINNPKALIKENQITQWAEIARLMIENDKRTESEINAVIEWCQSDSFWKSNILSMSALRKQFDQLWLKMQRETPSAPTKEQKWQKQTY